MEIIKSSQPQPTTSRDLSQEHDLTTAFQADLEKLGLIGESENATIAFLVAVSARLPKPLQLTVFGPSSAGKNYVMNTATSVLPDDWKKSITGMTPKTLMHAAETEFQHKAIIIAEYEGAAKADYAIRTFQSEQRIEWEFVDTKKGIQKKKNTVLGPAAFLIATTRPLLHPENETRLLFIRLNESPEQTKQVVL